MTQHKYLIVWTIAMGMIQTLSARIVACRLWGNLEKGPYGVGFRMIRQNDYSRTFFTEANRPESGASAEMGRPVSIYLWYPIQEESNESYMRFGSYVEYAVDDFDLSMNRDMSFNDKVRMDIPLFRGLSEESWAALIETPTAAVEDATPHDGTFPIIVIGQGLYYESPLTHAVLCEYLASHGYVAATCPLIGTHSRLVHLNVIDLETQIRDMEFALSQARQLDNTHASQIGVLGFDLGGMSGLILTMRNPDVDAFVSLDAGILFGHPSELPDKHPNYDILRFRAPWMHLTSARAVEPNRQFLSDQSLFGKANSADMYLIWFDELGHVDFTSYAQYGIDRPMAMYWGPRQGWEGSSYNVICQYVLNFFDAYIKGDKEGEALLQKAPVEVAPESVSFNIERKSRKLSITTRDDFLNAMLHHEFESALDAARQIHAFTPDAVWLGEALLNRLGYAFMYQYMDTDAAKAIFELAVELYPQSANTYDSLGEAYFQNGEMKKAMMYYEKSLELNPDNANAKAMLDRLKSQGEE